MSHSAHSIIEHIASFTSQRDMDLLVFSLLKSMSSIIKTKRVSVIRFDHKHNPVKELSYTHEVCNVIQDDIQLNEDIHEVMDYMLSSNIDKYTHASGDAYLSVYRMSVDQYNPTYLTLNMAQKLSHLEDYLLTGMLAIYKNFNVLLLDAQTDELTGLPNRKTFETSIRRIHDFIALPDTEFADEKREPMNQSCSSYWLAILDIDFFKKINDSYGHLYGDEVLIKLAQIMRRHFRGEDLVFRLGGEEFIVLLRCPDKNACTVAIERFREFVAATDFPGTGKVTLSGGVVKVAREIFHVTLLDYADQALYYSKNNGRNCITFFDDLMAKGIARTEIFQSGGVDLF